MIINNVVLYTFSIVFNKLFKILWEPFWIFYFLVVIILNIKLNKSIIYFFITFASNESNRIDKKRLNKIKEKPSWGLRS